MVMTEVLFYKGIIRFSFFSSFLLLRVKLGAVPTGGSDMPAILRKHLYTFTVF